MIIKKRLLYMMSNFRPFSQQSFATPVGLQNAAAAMFRKILAAELPPFHEGNSSNIRRLHNAQALIEGYWPVCVDSGNWSSQQAAVADYSTVS
jgi:hypothetical protein